MHKRVPDTYFSYFLTPISIEKKKRMKLRKK